MRISAGEHAEKLKPSYTADGNIKWYSCLENGFVVPQMLNIKLVIYDSAMLLFSPRKPENTGLRKFCMSVHSISVIKKCN